MKIIYNFGPNLLDFLDKIAEYGPMVESLLMKYLGDLFKTLT